MTYVLISGGCVLLKHSIILLDLRLKPNANLFGLRNQFLSIIPKLLVVHFLI